MTCIVGLEHNGIVYMGGDSAGVAGYNICTRSDEKVFTTDEFLMGFTSSFRMGQLLRYALDAPRRSEGMSDVEYLVTDFVDAVRGLFRNKGFLGKEGEEERGGVFLLGYRGHLYYIDCDFQVGILADGYAAVGCGAQIALGALYATREWADPKARLKVALEAAEHCSAGVRGPYTILGG